MVLVHVPLQVLAPAMSCLQRRTVNLIQPTVLALLGYPEVIWRVYGKLLQEPSLSPPAELILFYGI